MKKFLILTAIMFAGLFLLCSCQQQPSTSQATPQEAPRIESVADPAKQITDAWQLLVQIRKQAPIDFTKLAEAYRNDLAKFIGLVDALTQTGLDAEIRQSLEAGKQGQNVNYHAQIVEKLIQYASYRWLTHKLEAQAGSFATDVDFQEAQWALLVVRSVAERRGAWAGVGDQYVNQFDAALRDMKQAMSDQNQDGYNAALKQFENLLTKMYLLSVFYELDGLIKARGQDENIAAEKVAEAQVYYRCIGEDHRRRDAEAEKAIGEMLAKPAAEIDVDTIRNVLKKDYTAELADINPALLGG